MGSVAADCFARLRRTATLVFPTVSLRANSRLRLTSRGENSTRQSGALLADGSRLSTTQQKNYSVNSTNFLLFRFGSRLHYLPFLMPPTPPTTTPKICRGAMLAPSIILFAFHAGIKNSIRERQKNAHKDSISKNGQ